MQKPQRTSLMPSFGPPGSRRRRALFFSVTGLATVTLLFFFREVLTPFALAVVLAYVLAPVVARIERVTVSGRALPRWAAVVSVFLVLVGALVGAAALLVPRLVIEATQAAREAPRAARALQQEWLPKVEDALRGAASLYGDAERGDGPVASSGADGQGDEAAAPLTPESIRIVPLDDGSYGVTLPAHGIEIVRESDDAFRVRLERAERPPRDLSVVVSDSLRGFAGDFESIAAAAFQSAQTLARQIVGGVFSFFIMLMLAAYMLVTSERILDFFRSLARPSQRARFDELIGRIDRGLAGVVRGQLLIALVNGALSAVGFWLADLAYWPILALVATLLSIIPIFGAILSSVPAVIVGLRSGLGTAAFVLVWIIGIHQLEANLLNPKIMGDAAKVHPVLVVFALLAGEHSFGIVGALLAVPLLSIAQSLFLHWREVALGVPARAAPSVEDGS